MNYRPLGKTDLQVSEIGFGGWGIGGYKQHLKAYGPKDDRTSLFTLDTSLDNGITFYDTANSYGAGHSEELLGKAFKFKRDKVIIATKGGYLNTFTPNGKNQDFSSKAIVKSIDESLTRLQTNYIDLYQIHDCPLSELSNETLSTLLKLKEYGIIRAVGFAGKSPDDTVKVLDDFEFDVVQVNFNLTDMRAVKNGLFKKCADLGVGIIARTPLVFGFLTGDIDHNTSFHSSDHRLRFNHNQIKKWMNVWDYYNKALIDYKFYSNPQKALVFCLSFNEVSVTNVGMSQIDHVIENVSAVNCPKFSPESITNCLNAYDQYYAAPLK